MSLSEEEKKVLNTAWNIHFESRGIRQYLQLFNNIYKKNGR